jgi:outer membrane biosynthesis protein TonB
MSATTLVLGLLLIISFSDAEKSSPKVHVLEDKLFWSRELQGSMSVPPTPPPPPPTPPGPPPTEAPTSPEPPIETEAPTSPEPPIETEAPTSPEPPDETEAPTSPGPPLEECSLGVSLSHCAFTMPLDKILTLFVSLGFCHVPGR